MGWDAGTSLKILGISAYYHDAAAALVENGRIASAAQEERFTRKKHDAGFPVNALKYCLAENRSNLRDIDCIVFYDKPLLKFERLLETYIENAPKGFASFITSMPIWMKEKLYLKTLLKKELAGVLECETKALPKLLFAEHHQSHAASAFYPSPFENAAVLCLDGVGEWATTSVWRGEGRKLEPVWQLNFPHSLGLLYSAFTYYTGFRVNSGEYKVMGLAPYGQPRYVDTILKNLVDLKEDGTFRLNMDYFDFATGLRMTNSKFADLFGGPARESESSLAQREMDLAASIQKVTEEILLRLGRTIHRELGYENLCLAGGVALNCVANGVLLREGPFKKIWIQPAAGDAGGALGAALLGWHHYHRKNRTVSVSGADAMSGGYLGPEYGRDDTRARLTKVGAVFSEYDDPTLLPAVAEILANGNVVGWVQGRMEFGPRALGARSIIGDARSRKMQSVMNLKIKYRESFRPFAPAVLAEKVADYFEYDGESPYMLMVAPVKKSLRIVMSDDEQQLFGIEKLNIIRSTIPAVTHVDYSARIQTVHENTNPRFHALLKEFEKITGCAVLVNTSFNVRGEPMVNTPEDAFRCFLRTEMDFLVVGSFVMDKRLQTKKDGDDSWKKEFALD